MVPRSYRENKPMLKKLFLTAAVPACASTSAFAWTDRYGHCSTARLTPAPCTPPMAHRPAPARRLRPRRTGDRGPAAHRHAGHRRHHPRNRGHGHQRREALVKKLLLAGVAALSLLLAGAAV